MINFEEKTAYTVEDLRRIVHLLRAPGGCPWDGAQTHESIRRNFLEEAYEVAEAIDEKNPAHLKEELGDVLLQVLFHASIEEDAGRFTLDDVADGIYSLVATADGYLATAPIAVTIAEGSIANVAVNMVVDSRTYNGTVSGIIRDSNGAPGSGPAFFKSGRNLEVQGGK